MKKNCKMPKYKTFGGKKFVLTAGTQKGTVKSHAQEVGKKWVRLGQTKKYRVVKGCGNEYYTYSLNK